MIRHHKSELGDYSLKCVHKMSLTAAIAMVLSVTAMTAQASTGLSNPTTTATTHGVLGIESSVVRNAAILAANNEVGIAFNENLMNYQENIRTLPSDTESGWMPGFQLKGSYMGNLVGINNLYAAVHYQRNSGSIAYMGSLSNGATYDGTDNATTNRVTARIGEGFNIPHGIVITPFIAGGIQNWNRQLQGPYGYTENYNAGLVGTGALFQYALNSHWVLSSTGEIMAVIGGGMTPSGLYGVPSGHFGSASFKTSAEEMVNAKADYALTSNLHLYGGVQYVHFNYTGGSLNHGAFEPSSQTNGFSMDAGMAYSY
jgi:hypothetical protein